MKPEDVERKARRILEPMRSCPVALSGRGQLEMSRSRLVSNLGRLIESVPLERARHARSRRIQAVVIGVASSLTVAAIPLLWFRAGPSEARTRPTQASRLRLERGQLSHNNRLLTAGVDYTIDTLGRLSTPRASGAEFVTSEGVRVAIAGASTADLDFKRPHRTIALTQGKIALSVPKLGKNATLSVATPDAVITVHGTSFSVMFQNDRTCVKVSEGIVSVARETGYEELVAGQESGCEPPRSTQSTEAQQSEIQSSAKSAPSRRGTLTVENRLFERALAAEQARRWQDAEIAAKRLLTRYPHSPMASEAGRVLGRVKAERAKSGLPER